MEIYFTDREIEVLSILKEEGELTGYEILKKMGTGLLLGQIYTTLGNLINKECVSRRYGDESPDGGRKKHYSLTITGEVFVNNMG